MAIDRADAMAAIAQQLPPEGITLREFFTRTARLCGDSEDTIEAALSLAEDDGLAADDIVERGPNGARIN